MKKSRIIISLYSSIILILVTTISICFSMSFALYNKYVNGNGTYGEVSLRSYYECGSGTEEDPYVITRPRHLYNFSRLQGLGIYGKKKHFQLGKVDLGGVNSSGVPMCYADDYSSTQKPYLDMSNSDRDTNPINAIGSEALPFYGKFDGQYVEIKNLNVYANPEDAGLFGYTAHGSAIENIFLSNITIHALGYTDGYDDLYSPESDIGDYAYFIYDPNTGEATTDFTKNYDQTIYTYYYANNMTDFEYREEGSSPIPSVSIKSPDASPYTFTSLLSGDLITFDSSNNIVPNIERIFEFFKEKKNEEDIEYPIRATSTASLVVSSVDSFGQQHSKVILTVEYNFTLDEGKDFISMGVHVGNDHGNNIGLVAGHCDGTVHDCYVYNGSFKMNDGGAGYNNLTNGSDLGLIGKVGGTVQNILANESDIAMKEGKSIGVLDFTTVYRDIIKSDSFDGSYHPGGITDGYTYNPISTSKYIQYLRQYNSNYITIGNDAISFKGREIVHNTDLGVFTVATDAKTTGMNSDAGLNIGNSVISSEDDLTIDDASGEDNYYIYYSTGEYQKGYLPGVSFANYVESYNDRTKTTILPGYHFPSKDQVSRESFALREARQNYFVRFKLDPKYRKGKGFYFSDVDTNTDGGAFLANYFNYKLVDQNGNHIPVGTNKCGVMLKNNLREEVSSLSASFALPKVETIGSVLNDVYCLEDEERNPYVSNMVNFKIVNKEANVTIIAAPSDKTKPSALGIYRLDASDFEGSINYEKEEYNMKFKQRYDNPDYAFFMPTDSNLSYFDYRVNSITHKGEVGVYDSNGVFTSATNGTDATVPAEYNYNEFGYETGKTRLFAHTFLLPQGRYCISSAVLSSDAACAPKVYYICAQGQDDGQFDFDDTVFTSNDRVENVDFIDVPRFNEDGTANIVIADISVYNPTSPTDGNKLGNRRLYVALVNSDRSLFNAKTSDLSFTYDPISGKFIIDSSLTGSDLIEAMQHVAVDNYKPTLTNGDQKELTIYLLGIESNGDVIAYPLYE